MSLEQSSVFVCTNVTTIYESCMIYACGITSQVPICSAPTSDGKQQTERLETPLATAPTHLLCIRCLRQRPSDTIQAIRTVTALGQIWRNCVATMQGCGRFFLLALAARSERKLARAMTGADVVPKSQQPVGHGCTSNLVLAGASCGREGFRLCWLLFQSALKLATASLVGGLGDL